MRLTFVALSLMLAAASLSAQVTDTIRDPGAGALAALYNAPAALRSTGPASIGAGQTVVGNVAVLNGPLTIRGEVRGRVVVINGNLLLAHGARVTGDIVVAGGTIAGLEAAEVGGQVRWYPETIRYQRDGERIVVERDREAAPEIIDWRLGPGADDQWRSRITIMSGGTYNRVEGLPILIGPSLRFRSDYTRVALDVLGIMRSAESFRWDGDNLGHDLQARIRIGDTQAIGIGGRVMDVVRSVEDWELRDSEVGLASFLVRRDYRDYYNTRGASAVLTLDAGALLTAEVEHAFEHWRPRESRDPFSLFRQGAEWRPNPGMDAGGFRVSTARVRIDSRNEPVNPRTGWFIGAEVEHGSSNDARLGEGHDVASDWEPLPENRVVALSYTRGFLDLRRFNRISPRGQLNLRAVIGGWLGGDDLPLQRRLSVGGAGSLPGYNFRTAVGTDVFTCGGVTIEGAPALCERILLTQVEYRGDLRVHLGGDRDWGFEIDRPAAWVVFANAGRGWLVEDGAGDGIRYGSGVLPPLRSFRTDVGAGLDLGMLGLFVAKSVSDPREPANFFIRLRHRF